MSDEIAVPEEEEFVTPTAETPEVEPETPSIEPDEAETLAEDAAADADAEIEAEGVAETPTEESPNYAQVAKAEFDKQNELLEKLDAEAAQMSSSNLEFGWICEELWRATYEDFMNMADGKERKALSYFLNVVQERISKDIENRKTVADRFKIARYFPRKNYEKIVADSNGYRPTFNQLRSLIITDDSGELDRKLTHEMIVWCIQHDWVGIRDIRAQRNLLAPKKVRIPPEERHWANFVKNAQAVMTDVAADHPHYVAAKAVVDLFKAEMKSTD